MQESSFSTCALARLCTHSVPSLISLGWFQWLVGGGRQTSFISPTFLESQNLKGREKNVDFRPLSVVDVGKTISTRGVKYLKVTGVEIVLFYFFLFFSFHSLSQFNLEGGTCLHLHHGHLQCTSCHPGCHQWNHLWAICLGLCGVETIQLCWTREDDRVTGHKWAGKCDENYSCGDTWLGKIIPNSTEEIGLTKDLVWSCPDSVNLFQLNANRCMLHAKLYYISISTSFYINTTTRQLRTLWNQTRSTREEKQAFCLAMKTYSITCNAINLFVYESLCHVWLCMFEWLFHVVFLCGFIDDASAGLLHLSKAFFDFPRGFLHNAMVVNCPTPAWSLHLAAVCSMFFQLSLILDAFGQCSQSPSEKPRKRIKHCGEEPSQTGHVLNKLIDMFLILLRCFLYDFNDFVPWLLAFFLSAPTAYFFSRCSLDFLDFLQNAMVLAYVPGPRFGPCILLSFATCSYMFRSDFWIAAGQIGKKVRTSNKL